MYKIFLSITLLFLFSSCTYYHSVPDRFTRQNDFFNYLRWGMTIKEVRHLEKVIYAKSPSSYHERNGKSISVVRYYYARGNSLNIDYSFHNGRLVKIHYNIGSYIKYSYESSLFFKHIDQIKDFFTQRYGKPITKSNLWYMWITPKNVISLYSREVTAYITARLLVLVLYEVDYARDVSKIIP